MSYVYLTCLSNKHFLWEAKLNGKGKGVPPTLVTQSIPTTASKRTAMTVMVPMSRMSLVRFSLTTPVKPGMYSYNMSNRESQKPMVYIETGKETISVVTFFVFYS